MPCLSKLVNNKNKEADCIENSQCIQSIFSLIPILLRFSVFYFLKHLFD